MDFTSFNPVGALAQGYQVGAGIRDDQLKQQQVQAALDQQAQQQKVLQALYSNPNPTADDYSRASLMLPQLREQLKQSWDIKNADQQQGWLKNTSQVYAALSNGRPDIAAQQINDRADLMQAQGMPAREVNAMRYQARMVTQNPDFARSYAGMMLAATPGGDKVIESLTKLGGEQRAQALAPAQLAKTTAEAATAGAAADVAPARNALEVRNLAEDAETKVANRRIADLEVQIKQANSETQRGQLVLERDKLIEAQGEKQRAKETAAQSQLEGIERSLSTVDAISKHPGAEGFFFGPGTINGKVSQFVPGTDRKSLQGLVDTLTSQQFLTSIKEMQGMGALSDAEGRRIASAVATLDLDQDAKSFKNAIGVVRATLEKARNKVVGSGQLPSTNAAGPGGGFVVRTPTYGNVTEGDINRLLQKYPGATRDQVMQFLQQGGATTGANPAAGATGSN